MFVCLCRNITDQQIKDAVLCGATCVSDVNKCFDAPIKCGKCGPYTKQIIKETLISCSDSQQACCQE